MPYIHRNGCKCLTPMEALNKMGEEEGKTGGEVLSEIMDEMGEEDRRWEADFSKPEEALKVLIQIALRDYKDNVLERQEDREISPVPFPCKVLEVLEIECNSRLRASDHFLKAKVECADGKTRIVKYSAYYDGGTYYDPPESEETLDWEELPQ